MAKLSLNDLRTRASTADRERLDATTEAEMEAYRAEDGYADLPIPNFAAESPEGLGLRLGLTQEQMAAALRIPLGT